MEKMWSIITRTSSYKLGLARTVDFLEVEESEYGDSCVMMSIRLWEVGMCWHIVIWNGWEDVKRMIINNWSLIIGWEQHYDEEQVEIVHSWLRRSIGFLKSAKSVQKWTLISPSIKPTKQWNWDFCEDYDQDFVPKKSWICRPCWEKTLATFTEAPFIVKLDFQNNKYLFANGCAQIDCIKY